MKKFKNPRSQKAFTLIELLVVISIIGILAAFAMVSFGSIQTRARDAQRKNDFNQITKALQMYYNDHNNYPICYWVSSINSSWDCLKSALEPTYMKKVPLDPKNTGGYPWELPTNFSYMYTAHWGGCIETAGTYFMMIGRLENTSDPMQPTTFGENNCSWGGTGWLTTTNP